MSIGIVYMGTPHFAVPPLRRLLDDGYNVRAVVTQPDRPSGRGKSLVAPPVKVAAQERGIEVLQPARLTEPKVIERLRELALDVIVVAAFGEYLPKVVLDLPRYQCVNLHGSLLPKYRGASPIAAAILDGEKETGITAMLMAPALDAGDIIDQARIVILPDDTQGSLSERLSHLAADLIVRLLPRWVAGEIAPRPQDEEKATYTRLVKKADGLIQWAAPAELIERQVRAYNPWPAAYTILNGQPLKILKAHVVPDVGGLSPAGTVVGVVPGTHGKALAIATDRDLLAVDELQQAGRRAMTAEQFLAGHYDVVGTVIGI